MDAEEGVVVKCNPGTRFWVLARLAKIMQAEGGLTLKYSKAAREDFSIFVIVNHRSIPCIRSIIHQ